MYLQENFITSDKLFEITAHNHYYVNPYFGCSERCPYCYWTSIPGWEGQITARVNIVEIFAEQMKSWDKSKRICFGSYCNPYELIEREYRLTRGLLKVCKEEKIPFMLTTSSSLIIDDIDLICSLKEQAIIVFELSRIDRLVRFEETGEHDVLTAANALNRRGVKVLATLSPYLKGITDLERILSVLDEGIPVYVGALDLKTNWTTAGRLLPEIYRNKPELLDYYGWLISDNNVELEYAAYMEQLVGNPRVKEFPLDIQYDNCMVAKNAEQTVPEKKKTYRNYSGEFKQEVIETMIRDNLSYRKTAKIFGVSNAHRVISWHKIYMNEGAEGLYTERRGKWTNKTE